MNRSKHDERRAASNTALTAVALQDHLMRSLSLESSLGPKRILVSKNPRSKPAKAVVDTGISRPKKKVTKEDGEYVIDARPVKHTLAQKMGLVEAPQLLLTEKEWANVKTKSNEREDSAQPCVICKEDFGIREQVLLSCTHVFHRACLEAFERFTGKKTCPMCRREQYQKRVIHEGAKQHRHKCATKIQALWRGYVVRCWYRKLRETVPPKDPLLRKKYYQEKLSSITERMVRSCDYDLNSFLHEMDRSLEASRDVFRRLETSQQVISEEEWEAIQLRAVERGNLDCPICLTQLEKGGLVEEEITSGSASQQKLKTSTKHPLKPKYSGARKLPDNIKLKSKGQTSINSFQIKGASNSQSSIVTRPCEETPTMPNVRERALLSCSHVFHKRCLEAFEEFAEGERKFLCPVCRTAYQKRIL